MRILTLKYFSKRSERETKSAAVNGADGLLSCGANGQYFAGVLDREEGKRHN